MTPERAPIGSASVSLRPARPGEGARLAPIIEAAYRGTGGVSGWTTEAHLLGGSRTNAAEVEQLIAEESTTVLVAVTEAGMPDGERVVGCCTVHPSDSDPEMPEFGLFAVDPAAQSMGVGRLLLDGAEDLLRSRGDQCLEIRVLQSRPELRAWYERRGFVATGEVRPFPGDPTDLRVAGLGMDVLIKELGQPGSR